MKLKIGCHLCLAKQTFLTALVASPSWHAEIKTEAENGLKRLVFNVHNRLTFMKVLMFIPHFSTLGARGFFSLRYEKKKPSDTMVSFLMQLMNIILC